MESRKPSSSVVASLMGLQEFSPQQPVRKKPRVLSDKYMRRVGSIGTREKHQDLGYLDSISKNSRDYNLLGSDEQNGSSAGKRKSLLSSEVLLSSSNHRNFSDCMKVPDVSNQRYTGREPCRGMSVLNDKLASSAHIIDVPMSQTRKVVENAKPFLMPNEIQRDYTGRVSTYGVRPVELRSSSPKNAAKRIGFVKTNMLTKDALSSTLLISGNSSRKAELTALSSLEQIDLVMTRTTGQELIIPGSRSLVSGTGFKKYGPCSGKSRQYGWKVRSIGCLRRPTPLHWDLGAIRNCESRKQDCNQKYSSEFIFLRKSPSGKALEVGNKNLQAENNFKKHSHFQGSYDCDTAAVLQSSKNSEHSAGLESDAGTEFVNKSPLALDEQSLDEENEKFLVEDQYNSSHMMHSSIQKDRCVGTYEKESISSYCSCTDPESTVSLEDAYQSSPISVLDASYRKENSSCSDSWEGDDAYLRGCLNSRLELLKSEISDVYSEDFDTMVSSEGDAREECVGGDIEADAMKLFRAEESRDFSYLVDVLNEARVLNMGLNTWHSEISLSVFDALEKKYGDQTYWKRTERRLLFDRINSGLLEILQSSITQHLRSNTVARRFILGHGQEDIEEEVWMILATQEKGVEKDYEKVMGKDDKWLDLADHIQDISREIANSLFDELVEDSFSI
ncbi:hypothetical protein LINGRAHAP2_LOCUS1665 [Linum grandiflorum]